MKKLVLLNWFGGKSKLMDLFTPFPKHDIFIDGFGGGASVILNKPTSELEVYNDFNSNLVNLLQVIQDTCCEFVRINGIKGWINSRAVWNKYRKHLEEKNINDDPIERAFKFYYVHRHSYSGIGKTFHGMNKSLNYDHHTVYLNGLEHIPEIFERLKYVYVENQDINVLLKRKLCNNEKTLIYLDPPYLKGGKEYEDMSGGNEFPINKLNEMIQIIKNFKSKIIISYDKTHEEIGLGDNWNTEEITRKNSVTPTSEGKRNDEVEYVIRNFDKNSQDDHIENVKVSKKQRYENLNMWKNWTEEKEEED